MASLQQMTKNAAVRFESVKGAEAMKPITIFLVFGYDTRAIIAANSLPTLRVILHS